ncbi:MAG: glycosyltransferase family 4 protein, partial [Elusimicrobia bacterium]|nr:glycosyltransferase family 4 protein [Elusimicrobiota bacterium]
MKILQVHNEYVYPGGEDAVAASEAALLRSSDHEVVEYRRSNREISAQGIFRKAAFYSRDIFFSRRTYREVRDLITRERPDVAHFHNAFLVIGPAAYQACFDAGIPVVQTLHNYRFLCAAATFFR